MQNHVAIINSTINKERQVYVVYTVLDMVSCV